MPRRVLWSSGLGYAAVDSEIDAVCRAAVDRLADAGCEVVEVGQVFDIDPGPVLGTLVQQYTRRTIEPFRGTPTWSRLDPLVVLMAELAAGATGLDIVQAIDACHRLGVQLAHALDGFDALLCPTTCGQTPVADMRHDVKDLLALFAAELPPDAAVDPLVQLAGTFSDLSFPLGTVDGLPVADFSRLTQPFNLTASPAGTVCAGFTGDGMPVGLQVVGHRLDDLGVLTMLQSIESLLGHAERVPALATA
jgi:aspartyl-tRNA(Asn)/glutamyl-tRNA(Gln) amidotransferase subunit A